MVLNNGGENFIDRLNIESRKYRAIFFKPILIFLDRIGLTPNILSDIRLFFGVIFLIWFYYGDKVFAAVFLLFVLFLDTFDGALARFQNKDSDRGKFLDTLIDSIIYSLVTLSLLFLDINVFFIAYNIFIIPVAYLLRIIKKQEFIGSDWVIKPYSQLSFLKVIVIIPFFLFVFFQINFLEFALLFDNILATVLSIYYLIFIQSRWKKVYGK
jgi:phosphatidylglycerophosphate synthase